MYNFVSYSAHDLFNDLINGVKKEFKYDGDTFHIERPFPTIIVVRWGEHRAHSRSWNFRALLDFQGMAACLKQYQRDIYFDSDGNYTTKDKVYIK